MREKDDLDLLLDSALATYADPGPDSDLENRVLAALSAVRSEPRTVITLRFRRWLPWAITVPIAAGLLLFWLSIARNRQLPSSAPQQARQSAPGPIVPHAAPSSEFRRAVPRRHPVRITRPPSSVQTAQAAALPKLDVFPTPKPLTAEEQALVGVVAQSPQPIREALVQAQNQDDSPVRIAAIHIPQLEPPDSGQH
jgi:hypothetical protein